MFNTETLFILGAGASAPYGYPIGKNLIKDIISDMEDKILIPKYSSGSAPPYWNKNDRTHDNLYEFDKLSVDINQVIPYLDQVTQNHVRQNSNEGDYIVFFNQNDNSHNFNKPFFCTEIKNINIFNRLKIALEIFDPVSIDTFLRDNPTYATAGKIMILYSLLKREDDNKFNLSQCSDNWYSLLLNDLVSECADKPEKLKENKVKFITFNYDVSLDYYLQTRVKEIGIFIKEPKKRISPADAFLNKLQINHVYGQLYSPVDTEKYGNYKVGRGKALRQSLSNDPSDYPGASQDLFQNFKRFIYSFKKFTNIKTMYDERNNPVERKKMISTHKANIEWAKEIIFIGFGFDRDNLNLLGISDNLWDFNQLLPGKTIRYLNFEGRMNSLALEFENLQRECKDLVDVNTNRYGNKRVNVIQSTADSICSAYQNDFKKFLFR